MTTDPTNFDSYPGFDQEVLTHDYWLFQQFKMQAQRAMTEFRHNLPSNISNDANAVKTLIKDLDNKTYKTLKDRLFLYHTLNLSFKMTRYMNTSKVEEAKLTALESRKEDLKVTKIILQEAKLKVAKSGANLLPTGLSKSDERIWYSLQTGDFDRFLINFLQQAEQLPKSDSTANDIAIDLLNKLNRSFIESKNIRLQEVYGPEEPALKGQVKPGFNTVFKDTDTLKQFLKNHFFIPD